MIYINCCYIPLFYYFNNRHPQIFKITLMLLFNSIILEILVKFRRLSYLILFSYWSLRILAWGLSSLLLGRRFVIIFFYLSLLIIINNLGWYLRNLSYLFICRLFICWILYDLFFWILNLHLALFTQILKAVIFYVTNKTKWLV